MEKGKKSLFIGTAAFVFGTILDLLFVFLICGEPFDAKFSISHFVAANFISAVIFLVANLISCFFLQTYFSSVTKKLESGKTVAVYKILGTLIVAGLAGLSIFPLDLFARTFGPQFEFVSALHRFFSRGMFVAMTLQCALVLVARYREQKVFIPNFLFVLYSIFCAYAFAFESDFFWSADFVIESIFLLGYFSVIYSHGDIKDGTKKPAARLAKGQK